MCYASWMPRYLSRKTTAPPSGSAKACVPVADALSLSRMNRRRIFPPEIYEGVQLSMWGTPLPVPTWRQSTFEDLEKSVTWTPVGWKMDRSIWYTDNSYTVLKLAGVKLWVHNPWVKRAPPEEEEESPTIYLLWLLKTAMAITSPNHVMQCDPDGYNVL